MSALRKNGGRAVERDCDQCGEPFDVRMHDVERDGGTGGRFCSRNCYYAWRREQPDDGGNEKRRAAMKGREGKRNPNWKNGSAAGGRERAVSRVFNLKAKGESTCRNCRKKPAENLHHAIPRSMYAKGKAELLNGLPLCVWCHLGWHRREVVIYRDVFTPEERAWLSSVELLGQDVGAWLDDRYPERGRAEC